MVLKYIYGEIPLKVTISSKIPKLNELIEFDKLNCKVIDVKQENEILCIVKVTAIEKR